MSKFFKQATTTVAALLMSAAGCASWAGPNDFFGSGPILPGAVGSADTGQDTPSGSLIGGKSAAQAAPAPSGNLTGGGGTPGVGADNTADEKRMQKKYKANISYFKQLIVKGEAMMQSAPNKDDKMYKKGKILKETGEKHLTELQTSSPYQIDPTLADDIDKKKGKDKLKDGKPVM